MARLVTLYDLQRDGGYDLRGEGIYDPTGEAAYTTDAGRVGTIRGALVDPDGGHKIRYLVVDTNTRLVIVPIGYARIEDDGVHFDGLTHERLAALHAYSDDEAYTYDDNDSSQYRLAGRDGTLAPTSDATTSSVQDERVLHATTNATTSSTSTSNTDLFQTPQRLHLLEERLAVQKERVHAGSVEVGKHVETRTEQVPVSLTHEEIVIERHAVTNPTPVNGDVSLGAGNETIRVDLEAERAEVRKQAFVTEEVTIGEREVRQTQTFTETVGREVLDVNNTGDVTASTTGVTNAGGLTGTTSQRDDRGLLERSGTVLDEDAEGLPSRNDGTDRR
ncbi:YsnF/AvaK domain-containing protein [Deinococcus yavapaiensis]|uniref:Uncharacterized protein (TIGR02271 family) n=1 Tax=Deinococcus yavapaiensis KR-236 TaxID=694435 RepID=A0A318SBE6_9DEIO|nr:DUF2382 domain-containing protein [Deinococcus yavapaiensis]PYE47694.1 uncharacterized protein (TIGR02271 family) [Deinococcus yavapaiensis KR-236]